LVGAPAIIELTKPPGFDAFSTTERWWAPICRSASQGGAAPPFTGSMKVDVGVALRMARSRTRRRLKRRR
jgi:coniferyl-aldehyde dehydrogenase